jgi:ribose transport system ATP-binding protein
MRIWRKASPTPGAPPSPLASQTTASGDDASTRGAPLLIATGVSKAFSGVWALQGVDFELKRGEVHALMGENGAGKSTLMRILAGVHGDYSGAVSIAGHRTRFTGVRDAELAGVAIIHQELNLVPELAVAENIFLGREPLIAGLFVDRRRLLRVARALLLRLNIKIDPESRVGGLRVGEQQLVEIAKALSLDARILIMDEPTSALSSSECETLFKVVRQLAAAGVAIIYTSHRIDEVTSLADRVTVLRDGRRVLTAPIGEISRDGIISAMVGREVAASNRDETSASAAPVLSVEDLTFDVVTPRGWRRVLHGVSFEVGRGEILGIGGLLGSGRTEIVEAIFGAGRGWRGGRIAIDGAPVAIASPADAYRLGVALVTEDRKTRGLHLGSTIRDNIALPSVGAMSRFGLRAFAREAALAAEVVDRLSVRCTGIEQVAATLSGGNQQKIVIGKWLATRPRVLLLDEPTRGIDVGAKVEVFQVIDELARSGAAILMVSSEMPELLQVADRILVMRQGRIAGELPGRTSQEEIMRYASVAGEGLSA